MDATRDGELQRMTLGYSTLWCRCFTYRNYRNVFAVYLERHGNTCHEEVHKVFGAVAKGERFVEFLVRSKARKNCYAMLSDAICSETKSTERRAGQWVVVEATDADSAILHDDVSYVREDLMDDEPSHSFCGVYFISNGNGAVKIGQTSASLLQRITHLQAGSAYPLRLVAVIHTTSFKMVEAEIHREHKHRRLEGEWFAMTDAEAVQVAESKGGVASSLKPHRSILMPKCRA